MYYLATLELHAEDLDGDAQVYIFFAAALLMLPYIYADMAGTGAGGSAVSTPGSRLLVELIRFAAVPAAREAFKLVELPKYMIPPAPCCVKWGTRRLHVRVVDRAGLATAGAHAHKVKTTTHLCCIAVH